MTTWTRSDLLARGLTDVQIQRDLRAGRLLRLARGVYTDADPVTREGRHLALCSSLPHEVLALESAALVHGLPVLSVPSRAQVFRPGTGTTRRSRHMEVRSGAIDPSDVETRDGQQVTTLSRTLVDLARVRGHLHALVPWEAALCRARLADEQGPGQGSCVLLPTLQAQLARAVAAIAGRKGSRAASFALAFATPWAESPRESVSRWLMLQLGLPQPWQQFEVVDEHGRLVGRTDFAWPERGVLGEYDGRGKYEGDGDLMPRDVIVREKRRQERLEELGWVVARWGAPEIDEPRRLAERLRRAFTAAEGRNVVARTSDIAHWRGHYPGWPASAT